MILILDDQSERIEMFKARLGALGPILTLTSDEDVLPALATQAELGRFPKVCILDFDLGTVDNGVTVHNSIRKFCTTHGFATHVIIWSRAWPEKLARIADETPELDATVSGDQASSLDDLAAKVRACLQPLEGDEANPLAPTAFQVPAADRVFVFHDGLDRNHRPGRHRQVDDVHELVGRPPGPGPGLMYRGRWTPLHPHKGKQFPLLLLRLRQVFTTYPDLQRVHPFGLLHFDDLSPHRLRPQLENFPTSRALESTVKDGVAVLQEVARISGLRGIPALASPARLSPSGQIAKLPTAKEMTRDGLAAAPVHGKIWFDRPADIDLLGHMHHVIATDSDVLDTHRRWLANLPNILPLLPA